MTIQQRIQTFIYRFGLTKGILLISGLFCFLPAFLDLPLYPPVEADSALVLSFESLYYHYALIACIAVSVPIIIDYAMDIISVNKESRSLGIVSHRDLILTLLLPDGILLWFILPSKSYAYFPCLLNARELFLLYAFLNRMKLNLPQVWTVSTTAPLACFFSVWKLFSVYTAFEGDLNLSTITAVTYFLEFLSVFVLILLYIRCYYITLNIVGGADNRVLHRYIIPYMTAFLMAWLGIVVIGFQSNSTIWTNTNPFYCISYTLIVGMFGSFISVLNGRMIRTNAEGTEAVDSGNGDISAMATILEEEPLSPWDFVRDTVKSFFVQAREAGVELEFDNPEEILKRENSVSMSQSNASGRSNAGNSFRGCINIMRLQVVDSGAGISE
eukprot:gene3337-6603_t